MVKRKEKRPRSTHGWHAHERTQRAPSSFDESAFPQWLVFFLQQLPPSTTLQEGIPLLLGIWSAYAIEMMHRPNQTYRKHLRQVGWYHMTMQVCVEVENLLSQCPALLLELRLLEYQQTMEERPVRDPMPIQMRGKQKRQWRMRENWKAQGRYAALRALRLSLLAQMNRSAVSRIPYPSPVQAAYNFRIWRPFLSAPQPLAQDRLQSLRDAVDRGPDMLIAPPPRAFFRSQGLNLLAIDEMHTLQKRGKESDIASCHLPLLEEESQMSKGQQDDV